jgi:hypothetical protein
MKNRALFLKDPLSVTLRNEGVSSNNNDDAATLEYELSTFVCDGEYQRGLTKILQGFLDRIGKEQTGAWVSGFYGSGKSHLVKVLRFLFIDYKLPNGISSRQLCTLPRDVRDLLTELSTRGVQFGGVHSAGGTLKAGAGDVRLRVLSIVFKSAGLPEKFTHANFVMDLRDDGKLETVRNKLVALGKHLDGPGGELEKLYVSKALHEAYLEAYPHLQSMEAVAKALREQYPAKSEEISIQDMAHHIKRSLTRDGQFPLTVLVLDEVQQFINDDAKIANDIQEVAETIQKSFDGKLLLVATGQSALSDTPALQKIMGRFVIKVHLQDNDVEKVVRTVVLQKAPNQIAGLDSFISQHSGEITRQLKTTRIATRGDDHAAYVPDYPLLPVRRRFWEQVLRSTDPSGTASQMRTQLRVTHEACRSVADKPMGTVIPGDFLYDQLAADLVISGEMQKRFQEIIEAQKKETDGPLRARICSLIFLINKLPRESGVDIGLRANDEHLVDLLVDNIHETQPEVRQKVPQLLEIMASDGILMEVEGEYRLQTTEGSAWESEFRSRLASAKNNEATLASQRAQILARSVQGELSNLAIPHGQSRERRAVSVHQGPSDPPKDSGLTVWVRDGFSDAENAILQLIQSLDPANPTIHVLIPKKRADDLKASLATLIASQETLNFLGTPTNPEGKDARASMETRRAQAQRKVDDILSELVQSGRVFLSGGQELSSIALKETVSTACSQVLEGLYHRFAQADSPNWNTAYKRAKEGNTDALTSTGYQGDPEKHPVAIALLQEIGAGKKGSELVAKFTAAPYGWPKDAIDATLATLLCTNHLIARINGAPLSLAELDQRKASQADYRIQHPVLNAAQKLKVKKLFQEAGHKFTPGDEIAAATGFVDLLKQLMEAAGGEPPAPVRPQSALVTDLRGLSGNDLLHCLFSNAEDLTALVKEWREAAKRIQDRLPGFTLAKNLWMRASDAALPAASEQKAAFDAVLSGRQLLMDPDPVAPIRAALASALRESLNAVHAAHEIRLAQECSELQSQPAWSKLPESERLCLLEQTGAVSRPAPAVGTDTELLDSLNRCDLEGWRTQTDAISARCNAALDVAIRAATPTAKRVKLPSATIHDEAELEVWLARAKAAVVETLKDGPATV